MARTWLQVLGWLLCMGSWGATIGVLLSHKWKSSTLEGIHHTVLDSVTNMEGLWEKCQIFPSGQIQCWPFANPLSSVRPIIVVCRTLLIFAILCGFFAGIVTFFGFKCTDIGPRSRKSQARTSLVCGIMFLISACCVTVASSAYIYDVTNGPPSFDPRGNMQVHQPQEAVKICLAFGLLWMIGSLLLIWGSRHNEPDDVTYNYQSKSTAQEYI